MTERLFWSAENPVKWKDYTHTFNKWAYPALLRRNAYRADDCGRDRCKKCISLCFVWCGWFCFSKSKDTIFYSRYYQWNCIWCENLAIDADEINLRIEKTVGALKIEDLLNRSLFALSGGEKQKIACASVSAMEPDIFDGRAIFQFGY